MASAIFSRDRNHWTHARVESLIVDGRLDVQIINGRQFPTSSYDDLDVLARDPATGLLTHDGTKIVKQNAATVVDNNLPPGVRNSDIVRSDLNSNFIQGESGILKSDSSQVLISNLDLNDMQPMADGYKGALWSDGGRMSLSYFPTQFLDPLGQPGIMKSDGSTVNMVNQIDQSEVSGLGALATQNQVNLNSQVVGVLPISSEGARTGDVTSPAGSRTMSISNSVVTNAKIANMPANTIKANITAGVAAPVDVTISGLIQPMLDAITNVPGSILYRGASWVSLPPPISGLGSFGVGSFLTSNNGTLGWNNSPQFRDVASAVVTINPTDFTVRLTATIPQTAVLPVAVDGREIRLMNTTFEPKTTSLPYITVAGVSTTIIPAFTIVHLKVVGTSYILISETKPESYTGNIITKITAGTTWIPSPFFKYAEVILIGGGGATPAVSLPASNTQINYSQPGGGGAYVKFRIPFTNVAVPVAIGTGGTPTNPIGNTSNFGSYASSPTGSQGTLQTITNNGMIQPFIGVSPVSALLFNGTLIDSGTSTGGNGYICWDGANVAYESMAGANPIFSRLSNSTFGPATSSVAPINGSVNTGRGATGGYTVFGGAVITGSSGGSGVCIITEYL